MKQILASLILGAALAHAATASEQGMTWPASDEAAHLQGKTAVIWNSQTATILMAIPSAWQSLPIWALKA
ncbi:hypothetical protein [Roseovarius sp. EL26]|uniref:hypothetical protein n=1 Tax=Roseovarius sp. EL26 TaxID=2126672 RepID=UPI001C1FE05F|nr:hypothetical protein [Roseovarius sp. EL26]